MDKNYSAGMIDRTLMDTNLNNRKKSIGEYYDLSHVFHENNNEKFLRNITENKKIYRNYKGIFTNMYDTANRNGHILKLFKNTNPKKEQEKENEKEKEKEKKEKSENNNSSMKSEWAANSNRIKKAREYSKNLLKGKKKDQKNTTGESFFSTVN
jgi:hypothetical protein